MIALFLFSYGLMNRSIDKWFSRPVEEVREHTAEVTQLLTSYAGQNALSEAQSIAASPETERAFQTGKFGPLMEELRRHEATLQEGFVIVLLDGQAQASFQAPDLWPILSRKIPLIMPDGQSRSFTLGAKDYVAGSAKVGDHGRILVAMPLPAKYSAVLNELEASQHQYAALRSERRLVRRTYMQLLLMLTLLVLFASTWFALFLSKLVTRPVLALAQATKEISEGRLDYRVEVAAGDELADLVVSFNRMAAELESNRLQIDASRKDLASAYATLEARGRHMETILENIPTAVLSLDADEAVTHVNDALITAVPAAERGARGTNREAGAGRFFPRRVCAGAAAAAAQGRSHGLDFGADGDGVRRHYPGFVGDGGLDECAAQRADCSAPAAGIRGGVRRSLGAFAGAEAGGLAGSGAAHRA